MSYDFNALLTRILEAREKGEKEAAIAHLKELSSHCPMTPLLWIQYAHDSSDDSILQQGIEQFPGSLLVHLYHVRQRPGEALAVALQNVGQGSHQGSWVSNLYEMQAQESPSEEAFVKRASCPIDNESLSDQVKQVFKNNQNLVERLDKARRWAARHLNLCMEHEQNIKVAMQREGLDYPQELDWDQLLESNQSFGMATGARETAQAFVDYAQAVYRHALAQLEEPPDEEEDEDAQHRPNLLDICWSIYERGVAECPTIAFLWTCYIYHIRQRILAGEHGLVTRLESVCNRAVRNCPYSVPLVQQQLQSHLEFAQVGHAVLDPDRLIEISKSAIATGFIVDPSAVWQVYQTALRVVTRRILFLLTPPAVGYDDAQDVEETTNYNLEEATEQEMDDLVEDIGDMYEEIETCLKKMKYVEGRALLAADQALLSTHLLTPLRQEQDDGNPASIPMWQKAVKLYQPTHPDINLQYIRCFWTTSPIPGAVQVAQRIRQTRFLFNKAIHSCGISKKSPHPTLLRDFDAALTQLGHEWLEFEAILGTEQSHSRATKSIQRKWNNSKRKQNADHDVRPAKKQKTNDAERVPTKTEKVDQDAIMSEATKEVDVDASKEDATEKAKPEVHIVRINDMDYPAHPFTVRVSNLTPETQDMDLVDLFRERCGAIVHARIIRDHHGTHSKGWGLVQFEEKDSVVKALEMDDVVGLHEKLVRVTRSHQPAAMVVPKGMHRVNPKGEGKHSKRNQKRREKQQEEPASSTQQDTAPEKEKEVPPPAAPQETAKASNDLGVLAFRPRGLARGSQQKRKIALDTSKEKSDTSKEKGK
jgi:hypothetical protein